MPQVACQFVTLLRFLEGGGGVAMRVLELRPIVLCHVTKCGMSHLLKATNRTQTTLVTGRIQSSAMEQS